MRRSIDNWQRLILDELSRRECFYLSDLLPAVFRPVECSGLGRAARALTRDGLIETARRVLNAEAGGRLVRLVCARQGTKIPKRMPPPRVKRPRGFATFAREKIEAVAGNGGRAAHALGRAHQYTHDEAVEAGSKGGKMKAKNQRRKAGNPGRRERQR